MFDERAVRKETVIDAVHFLPISNPDFGYSSAWMRFIIVLYFPKWIEHGKGIFCAVAFSVFLIVQKKKNDVSQIKCRSCSQYSPNAKMHV